MPNIFMFLTGLVICFLYPTGLELDTYVPWLSLAGTIGLIVLVHGPAALVYRSISKTVRTRADRIEVGFRKAQRLERIQGMALFVGLAASIYLLHWPLYVRLSLGLSTIPFAGTLMILMPFLIHLLGWWASRYPLYSLVRPGMTFRGYLDFQVRGHLSFVALPVFASIALFEMLPFFPSVEQYLFLYPFLTWLLILALLTSLFALSPWIMAIIWAAKPIPDGPRRERLLALCTKASFKPSQLYIWPTHGARIANAFITGLFPGMQAVFFTDFLIDQVPDDELDAVLAHEIGHSQQRHLVMFFLYIVAYIILLQTAELISTQWLAWSPLQIGLMMLVLVVILLGGVLGFASRRLESEADVYGATLIQDPVLFSAALLRIGDLNGIRKHKSGWRHFSIPDRIRFLADWFEKSEVREAFNRRLRSIRLGLVAILFLALVCGSMGVAYSLQTRPEREALLTASRQADEAWNLLIAIDEGAFSGDTKKLAAARDALDLIEDALRVQPENPVYLTLKADSLYALGRKRDALDLYERILGNDPSDMELRIYLQNEVRRLNRRRE